MSNKKQSSIDWLIEQLEEKGKAWENVSIRRLNISIDVSDYLKLKHQAKEMHKEEVRELYLAHVTKVPRLKKIFEKQFEEYYTNTFE